MDKRRRMLHRMYFPPLLFRKESPVEKGKRISQGKGKASSQRKVRESLPRGMGREFPSGEWDENPSHGEWEENFPQEGTEENLRSLGDGKRDPFRGRARKGKAIPLPRGREYDSPTKMK